jgi:hypothetical protein
LIKCEGLTAFGLAGRLYKVMAVAVLSFNSCGSDDKKVGDWDSMN